MPDNRHVTIIVVADDAPSAEATLALVKRSLRAGASTKGLTFVPVGGGPEAVISWLTKDTLSDQPTGRLVVAPSLSSDLVLALLRAGADGILAEHSYGWLLRHATAVVTHGGRFLDPWLAHGVADLARPRLGNLLGVSGPEQRVLTQVARGLEVPSIAATLGLTMDTVRGHLATLQDRLGVGRQEMVGTARAAGLLPPLEERRRAAVWENSRGLQGLTTFVLGRERLARETLVRALTSAGSKVIGHQPDAGGLPAGAQWRVTLVLARAAVEELHQLRTARPRAALVMLPWALDAKVVQSGLAVRAQGIVGVNARLDELVAAIRVAACGGLYLDTAAVDLILAGIEERPREPAPLTIRQVEVLALVERGYTNRQIARELAIAEPTVKGHLRHALHVLGASHRKEGAAIARRLGFLGPR